MDSYGPRLNLACAAVLLLSGYLGIRAYYTDVFAYTGIGSLAVLCLFTFATGAGSSAGLASAVNTAAKVSASSRGLGEKDACASKPRSLTFGPHRRDRYRASPTKPGRLRRASSSLDSACPPCECARHHQRAVASSSPPADRARPVCRSLFSTLSHSFFPGNTADFLVRPSRFAFQSRHRRLTNASLFPASRRCSRLAASSRWSSASSSSSPSPHRPQRCRIIAIRTSQTGLGLLLRPHRRLHPRRMGTCPSQTRPMSSRPRKQARTTRTTISRTKHACLAPRPPRECARIGMGPCSS